MGHVINYNQAMVYTFHGASIMHHEYLVHVLHSHIIGITYDDRL